MIEVHIAQQRGETMSDLRRRVRVFCETNRVPFEQAGQVPQALAIFVVDEATREAVQQGLADPVALVATSPPEAVVTPPAARAAPSDEAEIPDRTRRETLRPSRS